MQLKVNDRDVLGNTNLGNRNGNHGYRKSRFYPSEALRSRLIELGVPRAKHDIVQLGEMLPDVITLPDKPEYWNINRAKFVQTKRYVAYGMYGTEVIPDCLSFEADTEADARAKMLVYLLENKIITI